MITISYIKSGTFDVSEIPEQWREWVTYQNLSGSRVQINIGVFPDDSSYTYMALMQFRQMILKFSLPFYWEFPVGSFVTYQGLTFYIVRPEDIKKQGNRKIEYSMTLFGEESHLDRYKFRNTVDGRLKWSMCARPQEFLQEICTNLNQRTGTTKWKVGAYIDSTEKTVEFNHTYLSEALNNIAATFETEWEIDPTTYTISLRKVEKFRANPLRLAMGRGNGFVPGVGRVSESGGEPVKRLYVQGGERNIDRSKYGDSFRYSNKPAELRLPKSGTIRYDGEHFEGESEFNAAKAHTYQSDEQGYYIERVDVVSDAVKDDSLDCSEIYPSRIGKCSELIAENPDKNFYDFVDDTIPANLDFNSYLIAGETMTIIFQTGMLAGDGKEFEVKYFHNSVNGKKARRFEIVPQEIDGITMPNETFKPVAGGSNPDTYAIFGIMLPDEYICDDRNKAGAAWDMMREAARKLYELENQKMTFSGDLQGKWAKQNWESVGAKLVIGGYVLFTDNQFAPNGEEIRITGIKNYLTKPYEPTIELSNAVSSSSNNVNSSLEKIDNTEVVIDDTKRDILQFTKRRFRDAKETIEMLVDAQLANFSGAIMPVAIQTMAALIGDESLQFIMGKTIAGLGTDDWQVKIEGNVLTAPSGYLRHMTIGVDSITSDRETIDFKTWQMPALNATAKESEKYYLYAVVNRDGFVLNQTQGVTLCTSPGEWLLDTKSHALTENASKYYLLVGILNSEYMGERSFATMYGFTEILPGQITTDIIKSGSGTSYFDLSRNKFKLGDKLEFNLDNDNVLRLKGALVQSSSGSESPLPCYRGVYSATARYYRGDVVTYTVGDITSTYICITTATTGIVGIAPNNALYWNVYAKGSQGQPGNAGKDAPIMVFRGVYDDTKTYYGNTSRVDCVKYGDSYYVALTTAPNGTTGFNGVPCINNQNSGSYWKLFGASFESIATSLLLAEKATIGNWFISGDNIVSTRGTVNGVESDDYTNPNFRPDVVLDGATGELVLYADKYPRVRISNQSVKTLFNESMVSESKISRYGTKSVDSFYMPASGNDYQLSQSIGTLFTLPLGQLNEGSKITISNFAINFVVPAHNEVPSATITASVNGVDLMALIKKDGVTVATLKGGSGTSTTTGNTLSIETGANGYTVPDGGGGNYTIEFQLKSVQFKTTNSGVFKKYSISYNVTGSYVHGGFNRTVIGNDGIGSFWNQSAMVFSANGFQVKCGTIGFKIDSSGIKRASNWVNDNPVWTDI